MGTTTEHAMQTFHNSMKLRIALCPINAVMKHARHFILNNKKKEPYSCTRCLRDKSDTKNVSLENSLLPSHVPLEHQNFTQREEMFIASVLCYEPSVCTKPEGQRAYRGHCIKFTQEV